MYRNTPIFVNVDLLLHEKEFNALQDFMKNLDPAELDFDDSIDYSFEKDCICITPLLPYECQVLPGMADFKRFEKFSSGYIRLTIDTLQKIFSY